MGYEELDTPSVIVDLDMLERNIVEMAAVAMAEGVQLRPHIKTHKTPADRPDATGCGGGRHHLREAR